MIQKNWHTTISIHWNFSDIDPPQTLLDDFTDFEDQSRIERISKDNFNRSTEDTKGHGCGGAYWGGKVLIWMWRMSSTVPFFFCGTGFGWGKVLYTEFHEAFGVLKFQKGKRQNIFEEMGQSWSFALGVLWNSKKINLCHITSSIFLNRSCLAVEDAWFHWNFFGCDVSQASRLIWPSFTGTRLCKWSKSNRIPLDWWHPEFSELNIASLWMIHHKPPISWWREICSVNLEATLLAPGHRALLRGGRIESQHFRWGSQLFDLLVYTT